MWMLRLANGLVFVMGRVEICGQFVCKPVAYLWSKGGKN